MSGTENINFNLRNSAADQTLSELRRLQKHRGKLSEQELAKLRKAGDGFEAIFLTQILKNMRKSIPKSGLFGDGLAGEFYSGMFDENIARTVAGKGGLQISDMIINSLTNTQQGRYSGQKLEDYKLRPIRPLRPSAAAPEWDRAIIDEAAKKYDLDPKLVQAVIDVESAGNPLAVSDKGAVGLMQLMPDTARELGVRDRKDPRQNVQAGARYLRRLLDRFQGDLERALAAYNAGPAAVEEFGGVPPYKETRRYVDKVLTNYRAL